MHKRVYDMAGILGKTVKVGGSGWQPCGEPWNGGAGAGGAAAMPGGSCRR